MRAVLKAQQGERSMRGDKRTDTDFARGLALFDELGVRKRNRGMAIYLTQEIYDLLQDCARARGVPVSTAAAYLIEKNLRDAIKQQEAEHEPKLRIASPTLAL